MSKVTGFLLRTSLDDTGMLPRTGAWIVSPDIIPAGAKAVSKNDLVQSYDKVFNENLQQGVTNFFYLRAKNMGLIPSTSRAWLFHVQGNLLLFPKQWYRKENLIPYMDATTGAMADSQQIIAEPGEIAVTNAYTWLPDSSHCLIGVIADTWEDVMQCYPGPVSSIDDLAQWIYAHGQICWHNVGFISSDSKMIERTVRYQRVGGDALIDFMMSVENIPVGARISFSSNSSTKSGEVIGVNWVNVLPPYSGGNINPCLGVSVSVKVDENYQTMLTYRADFCGTIPPDNFSMSMKAIQEMKGENADILL